MEEKNKKMILEINQVLEKIISTIGEIKNDAKEVKTELKEIRNDLADHRLKMKTYLEKI